MRNHAGRMLSASLLAGALGLFAGVPVASAWEWYFGGFVGGAFPQDIHFTEERLSNQTNAIISRTTNRSLNSSLVGGAKAGVCPRFFPYLCAEVEFDYFTPDMEGEAPFQGSGQSVDDFVNRLPLSPFDFHVYDLGLNLIGRVPLLKQRGYPLDGRLHLYLGAGPAFIWTTAQDRGCVFGATLSGESAEGGIALTVGRNESRCNQTDSDFSVGVQALGGFKFFLTKYLAVFTEYKFKHWSADFPFSGAGLGGGAPPQVRDIDFNVHLFYVGLAFHY